MSIAAETIRTTIPARLDRLPWSRWHWLIVVSLGTVWVLDGLEVTIKGAVGASLKDSIGFSTVEVAGSASIYLFGAISGALVWGYLTDRFGRQLMFILTITTYMVGVVGTTLAGLVHIGISAYLWFAIFRFITGFGIGGEYAAVNSAIDELMPARVRGWVALTINGSYWVGTIVGASLGFVFLQTLPSDLGWRLAFGIGGFLALGILLLRLFVPESPRWLITHGREAEAERSIEEIERRVREDEHLGELEEPSEDDALELRERESIGFITLARTVFGLYPRRALTGFTILVTQAFLYNAIFFTYGLMLTTFFGVSSTYVALFLIPFAVGNFLGPLLLGPLFDSLGRRLMIPATFWIAGVLTIVTGFLFWRETLANEYWMTVAWVVIFFFASAGASAGYLTVSETFPLEIRALAIAFFYAIGTAAGGIAGPYLYGSLIATEARVNLFYGYLIGGGLMLLGGVVHRIFGVEAARKSLEQVAPPLSAEDAQRGERRIALEGPLGIDLADASSIERFQREHELEPDAVIGPRTMGAIAAGLAGADGDGSGRAVLDLTDADSVRAFQERAGVTVDGIVGPETRGALAATHLLLGVDPGDAASVERFQETFGVAADGILGPATQAAMRAVAAERGLDDRLEVDPTEARSVRAFQRLLELEEREGEIGVETRGALAALRVERERSLGADVTDPDEVRGLQRSLGVPETGRIDGPTRERLHAEVERRRTDANGRGAEDAARPLLDPTVEASIRRFQREHGLREDGIVGPETRQALREQRYRTLGVDAGDPDSIRAFQREHNLSVDGVIGPEVQGAMNAVRSTLPQPDGDEEEQRDGDEADEQQRRLETDEPFALDTSDAEAVRAFQEEHGLVPDGIVGPLTQAAIRAVRAERRRSGRLGETWAGRRDEERITRPYELRQIWSGFHYPPLYPSVDRAVGDEVDEIVRSLDREGPARSRELYHRVHAERWGPGRFRRATRVALDEGRVRRRGGVLQAR